MSSDMLSIFSFDQMVGFFNTGGTPFSTTSTVNVTRDFAMALIPGMDWNSRTLIFTTYLGQVGFNHLTKIVQMGLLTTNLI